MQHSRWLAYNHKNPTDMHTFLHVSDIGPLDAALAEAAEIKADRYQYEHLGRHRTVLLIFFNNSINSTNQFLTLFKLWHCKLNNYH